MENLCGLFFELSNEDRVRILHQLSKEAMNVTRVSKEVGLTIQEASRHLSRLVDVGLIQKDVQSLYHISTYGKLILKELPALEFTSQYKNYFNTHSLERLPSELVCRIGDLANSTHVDDVMAAFHNVDRVFAEAEEYVWVITDQYLVSTWYPLTTQAIEREAKVRQIEAKDWVVPLKMKEAYRAEDMETARRARISGLLKERILDRLDVCLYMSEKEVALVTFPLSDGRFDYLGFAMTDEKSHQWCRDLFQFHWERARDRGRVAGELYEWLKKRPKALNVFRAIAAEEEIAAGEELISELESLGLVKKGKLTKLGDVVYRRLGK